MLDTINSYGAVVLESTDRGCMVLLVTGFNGLSFPKGHIEQGETDEQTALREVKEETGIDIEIIKGFKGKSDYSIQGKIEKTVYIFAAKALSTATKIQVEEIEDYKWIDYRSAMKSLRFDNDRSILWRAHSFLKKNGYLKQ